MQILNPDCKLHVSNHVSIDRNTFLGLIKYFLYFTGLQAPRQPLFLVKVSVGATQNTIMAACLASGTTTIENASIEPETLDLVKLLKSLGVNIEVDKARRKIKVEGKKKSYGVNLGGTINHTVIPDRIEAGTYAIAAAITGIVIEDYNWPLFLL